MTLFLAVVATLSPAVVVTTAYCLFIDEVPASTRTLLTINGVLHLLLGVWALYLVQGAA